MIRPTAAFILAIQLSACAIVEVRADDPDKDVRLSLWPLGVAITAEPHAADGVTVNAKTIGLATGCGVAGAGATVIHCTEIDPSVCGVAIISDAAGADETLLGMIAEETQSRCEPRKGHSP